METEVFLAGQGLQVWHHICRSEEEGFHLQRRDSLPVTVGAEPETALPTALGSGSLEEGRRLPSGSQKAAPFQLSQICSFCPDDPGSDFLTLINPDLLISWQIELSFS